MDNNIKLLLAAGLLALLTACDNGGGGGGNGNPGPEQPEQPEPEPEISLDETGSYRGSLQTSTGDIALLTLFLARDGATAIGIETDDSERPAIVLVGQSSGEGGAIDFSGSDTRDGSSVALDIAFEGGVASGNLSIAGLDGEYQLQRDAYSERSGELAAIAGDYAREDSATGPAELSIAEDGSVSFSGPCSASGTLSSGDVAVNLYRLQLSGDCIDLDVLLSREDVAAEGDVLVLLGVDGEAAYASQFYRN